MGKRRRERDKSDIDLMKRIKRLEKEFGRKRSKRSTTPSYYSDDYYESDQGSSREPHTSPPPPDSPLLPPPLLRGSPHISCYNEDQSDILEQYHEENLLLNNIVNEQRNVLKSIAVCPPTGAPSTGDVNTVTPAFETAEDTVIQAVPAEILSMLGESKTTEDRLGKKIPNEISERWGKILLEGLAKETKEALLSKTLIPENFQLAKAPKLNAEVASVLTEPAKNRDKRLEKSQNQLGSGIAGLVSLTTSLIDGDLEKMDIIKRLSEINQVLLDLHYEETLNRRRLIIPMLDKNFWNIIQGVKRDNFLFGNNLCDSIKASKDIEKSGQQIRKPMPTQASTFKKAPGQQQGNLRRPPRQGAQLPAPPASAARGNYAPPTPRAHPRYYRGQPARRPLPANHRSQHPPPSCYDRRDRR